MPLSRFQDLSAQESPQRRLRPDRIRIRKYRLQECDGMICPDPKRKNVAIEGGGRDGPANRRQFVARVLPPLKRKGRFAIGRLRRWAPYELTVTA